MLNQSSQNQSLRASLRTNCGCEPLGGRRRFVGGLGGLGAAVLASSCAISGSGGVAIAERNRIDTHHHVFPPTYVTAAAKVNQAPPIVRNWSMTKTIDDMDAAGVATSIMSITTPQLSFTDATSGPALARECNEWTAKLNSQYKGRFGNFAVLPMHNMDVALKELEYAMDVLKADGVGLLTSYEDKWLGHPFFIPLMKELNRRKAICYTHPTAAACCRNLQPEVPTTVVEFGTDTTRTIVDLVFSGRAAENPDIKFIFSHAGGTLPFLTERLIRMPMLDPKLAPRVPNGVLHELKKFYYDTAWTAHPYGLASLLQLVGVPQVLLGSDYPYRTGIDNVNGLNEYGGFNDADRQAIMRGNALRIIPRLA